ncbi:MAG: protein-disulfide reductase DsbD family protein [Mariniblastus sp.]
MNSSFRIHHYARFALPLAYAIAFAIIGLAIAANPAHSAQDLFLKDQFGDTGGELEDPVSLSAEFKIKTGTRQGILNVQADIDPAWHIFSLDQKKGPMPSKITVLESNKYKLVGKFKPDHKPETHYSEDFKSDVEEHEGTVVWSAPIMISDDVDIEDVIIEVVYNGQTCESKVGGVCLPIQNVEIEAEFEGFDDSIEVVEIKPPAKAIDFTPDGLHAKIKARIIRAAGTDQPIVPGDVVKLEFTATSIDDYHVYAYDLGETPYLATVVGFTETNDWNITGPSTSVEPVEGEFMGEPVRYHHDPITWTFLVSIPETAEEKTYNLAGAMGIQTCTDTGCDLPGGVEFSVEIPLGKVSSAVVVLKNGDYDQAKEAINAGGAAKPFEGAAPEIKVETTKEEDRSESVKETVSPELASTMAGLYNADEKINYVTINNAAKATFWTAIFGAFIGGILLNLMPCVFPVLGLKVMGFVQQAGSDPKKIRNHGLAFTAGLVVSMWILAGVILFLKLSLGQSVNWGQQMGNPYFVCAMIVLLFLLGLNMAGLFEIGTSLSSVGGNTKQKGYAGSFFSGILTTLIATPCSGPFLGAAMGYTIAQPAAIALFLFTVFALGISMPYLVLSFFPSLISRLPRPGEWMETFKVIMAFTLFAVVAFFAKTFGAQTGVIGLSWLVMALVVIGLAAYMYGKWSPSDVPANKRFLLGFLISGLLLAVGGKMCYDASGYKGPVLSHGAWKPWSPGKVEYTLASKKKIIWVDYTADW